MPKVHYSNSKKHLFLTLETPKDANANYDYGKKEHIVRQHEIGLFNKYMKNEQ